MTGHGVRWARKAAPGLARTITLAVFAVCAGCAGAFAQGWEPPPEAPEGGDWVMEAADSLDDGWLEVDLSAAGARGEGPRRARRVRFRGGGTAGALRDGDDPLSGGDLETGVVGGSLRFGRLAPRWGRGLVLGGAAEPWSRAAEDRGEHSAFRGRAGEGATWVGSRAEFVAGRFSKRTLFAGRTRAGPVGLGWLGGGARRSQASLAFGSGASSLELAGDRRGRWRVEWADDRELDVATLSLRVRGGHPGFTSLAEPKRSGPARALAATLATFPGERHAALHAAIWSFSPGVSGTRGALEVGARLSEHAAFDAGFEEQRGPRRESERRGRGLRQGFWSEVRAQQADVGVTLRHELWGEHAFARSAVRRALSFRVQCAGPGGSTLSVTHWAWAARSGESLYLPEIEGARLALRALRGVGDRSRVEAVAPVPGGRARFAITLAQSDGGERDVRWTAEWSRRGRL